MNVNTPRESEASQSERDMGCTSRPNIVLKEFQLSFTPTVWLALIGLLSSALGTAGYIISVLAR